MQWYCELPFDRNNSTDLKYGKSETPPLKPTNIETMGKTRRSTEIEDSERNLVKLANPLKCLNLIDDSLKSTLNELATEIEEALSK